MKEYLSSLLTVLLISGLASALMPEGQSKKGVRFGLSVLVLVAVMLPIRHSGDDILHFFSDNMEGTFDEGAVEDGEAWRQEILASAMEQGLAMALTERYGLPGDSVRAEIIYKEEELKDAHELQVTALTLHLYGRACYGDVPGMIKTAREEIGVDCEVVYHREQ